MGGGGGGRGCAAACDFLGPCPFRDTGLLKDLVIVRLVCVLRAWLLKLSFVGT